MMKLGNEGPRWCSVGATLLLMATTTFAADPELTCAAGRTKAAGKYAKCVHDTLAKRYEGKCGTGAACDAKLGTCATKYAATWAKLQAKTNGTGELCDNARFADNGNGTLTDRLTGLQ